MRSTPRLHDLQHARRLLVDVNNEPNRGRGRPAKSSLIAKATKRTMSEGGTPVRLQLTYYGASDLDPIFSGATVDAAHPIVQRVDPRVTPMKHPLLAKWAAAGTTVAGISFMTWLFRTFRSVSPSPRQNSVFVTYVIFFSCALAYLLYVIELRRRFFLSVASHLRWVGSRRHFE
jgi:hypothetical protein